MKVAFHIRNVIKSRSTGFECIGVLAFGIEQGRIILSLYPGDLHTLGLSVLVLTSFA